LYGQKILTNYGEPELDEQGYQNIVVREMVDAILRTAVEEDLLEQVAERFEQGRESASPKSYQIASYSKTK
jgi:hypothetical protein